MSDQFREMVDAMFAGPAPCAICPSAAGAYSLVYDRWLCSHCEGELDFIHDATPEEQVPTCDAAATPPSRKSDET